MNARVLGALFLVGAFALGALALAGATRDDPLGGDATRRFEGAILPAGLRAPDFTLRDQDGKRVTMRELRGRPVIVTFLYTTCEESCPTQAQQIKGAFAELGKDFPAVAVAVDPSRDTPARARAFLTEQRMTGRLDFALGTRAELEPVWEGFAAEPQRANLEHSGRLVLVDAQGVQRVSFPIDQVTPDRIAHDLRLLAAGA
ncbi:MAG: SCO family protein [Thermoleophilaceae bacterium]